MMQARTVAQKMRLEPGHIKSSWLVSRGYIKLSSFLKKMGYNVAGAGAAQTNIRWTLSGSRVIALEKVIHVGGAQPVTLQYECNTFTGVYVDFGRRRPAIATYGSNEKNFDQA